MNAYVPCPACNGNRFYLSGETTVWCATCQPARALGQEKIRDCGRKHRDDCRTLRSQLAERDAELSKSDARLHEVAVACATAEGKLAASEARGEAARSKLRAAMAAGLNPSEATIATLTAELAEARAELEKETAHSKHLAGAVSRKIDELIAAENQCGYYKTQYSRAEQVRKEACEANVKAQAAMLWLTADLERSRQECEGLREALDRIAAYPMTPQDEIGYTGCRKIAIEALKGRGEK